MLSKAQEQTIVTALRLMANERGYAHTAGYLEGNLLTILELYVRDRDVETVVRSFTRRMQELAQ